MVLDILIRLIETAVENSRRAAAPQPAPRLAEGERPRGKKSKKKKNRTAEAAPAWTPPPPVAPAAPRPAVIEDASWAVPTGASAPKRDLRRMFIIGELLDPPLALREEE